MKKTAFLFPGQGSQFVGMGHDLYENFPEVTHVFDAADALLDRSLSSVMFKGPEELLRQTENTQPALYTMCCGLVDALQKRGIKPAVAAGHSLGEYAAFYAAGVFSFEEGLSLVEKRGQLIRDCCAAHPGTMCAIIGLRDEQLEKLAGQLTHKPPAEYVNFNSPEQVVCAGSREAIEEVEEKAKTVGALKVVRLNVSGPFHSSFMHDAAHHMREVLQNAKIADPLVPVISNVNALPSISKDAIIETASEQIDHPVLWERSIRSMESMYVNVYVEIGPGRVLTGLNRRINKNLTSYNIENKETLESVIELLKEESDEIKR